MQALRSSSPADCVVRPFVVATLLLGFASRLLPICGGEARLLRQFPTEDGYLTLTIARNIALGLGMSTAEGSIPTNGTQPLATLLYASLYWLVDGDRVAGVRLSLVAQLVIALLTAALVYRLGSTLLGGDRSARLQAALGAAAWFASPVVLPHSMNCLETGLYGLALVLVFYAVSAARGLNGIRATSLWFVIGASLSLAFWARNDAVLLCAAIAIVQLAGWTQLPRQPFRQRLSQLAIAGSVVTLFSAPWLAHNLLRFGHVMPISGQSEALDARFGENLRLVLPNLLEYCTLLLPIPSTWKREWRTSFLALLMLCLAFRACRRGITKLPPEAGDTLRMLAVFAALLSLFYGLWFGAGYFMSRYLFALSPILAIFWGAALLSAFAAMRSRRQVTLAMGAVVLLLGAFQVRAYLRGMNHLHFHVVEWVHEHVANEEWVGAVQTGTLGYFHARTLNLDGKVNPHALAARQKRDIPRYVARSSVEYMVDWVGLREWAAHPEIADNFQLEVQSVERNLTVFRRRASKRRDQEQERRVSSIAAASPSRVELSSAMP